MPKKATQGGGIEETYNISERIEYWMHQYRLTGKELFKRQADRLRLEADRNNKRLQLEALKNQPKLFPDAGI